MSIYTITIDDVMKLDKKTLAYALRIFQQELDGMLALLRESPEAATDEQVLDDLSSVLTLRKVYTLRLEELAQEQQQTPPAKPQLLLTASSSALATAA